MPRFILFACFLFAVASLWALDPPHPVLILDRDDRPWAAWVERRGPVTVGLVARWDGAAWLPAGGPLNRVPNQSVSSVSLAWGPDGKAWAAWGEVGTGSLHVARWSGSAWVEPGPSPSRSGTAAEQPQLKIDSRGRPWVLWRETSLDSPLENEYLAFLDGAAWTLVGSLTTPGGVSSRSRDWALGSDDRPVLAHSQMVPHRDFQLFVGPWEGDRWTPTGPTLNLDPYVYAAFPSLVLDAKGVPTVAFLQVSDGFKLEVKRWTGSTWQLLGSPGSLGARCPKVALSGTSPVVVDVERWVGITAKLRTNEGWVDLGMTISTPGAFVDSLDLAIDSQGNPWLLWAEDDAQGQRLALAQWDGSKWQPFAPPPFQPK